MGLIHDLPTVISATAAPGQVSFTFPFKAFSIDDFDVSVNDVPAVYNAAPVGPLQYKVLFNIDEGGEIVFGAPAVGGEEIIIVSDIPIERVTQFPNTGPVPMSEVNLELNRHIRIMQDLDAGLDRTIQVSPDDTVPPVGPLDGYQEGDTLVVRGGSLRWHDRPSFAGRYFAGDISGGLIPASGTGSDPALRADLADPTLGSKLVAFRQAGVGAATRTVEAKAREVFSVTDFGADPTGTVDSYAAITACVAAAIALNYGAEIVFPAGFYIHSQPLNFGYARLRVRGEGRVVLSHTGIGVGASVLIDAGDGSILYGHHFENFVIRGNGLPGSNGILFRNMVHATRRNLYVRNVENIAFDIRGDVLSKYDTCVSSTHDEGDAVVPKYDFSFGASAAISTTTDCTFVNCISEVGRLVGMLLDAASNCTWIGGSAESLPGIGLTASAQSFGNTFIQFFCEKNVGGDAVITGSDNHFIDCTFTSLALIAPFESVKSIIVKNGAVGTHFEGRTSAYNIVVEAGAQNTCFEHLSCWRIDDAGTGTTKRDVKETFNSSARYPGMTLGNVAAPDPKVLDWYEEGTFLPTLTSGGGAGVVTYTEQQGSYQRVGNTVTVWGRIAWSANTYTGPIRITSLPFNAKTRGGMIWPVLLIADNFTYAGDLVAWMIAGTSTILVYSQATGAALAPVAVDAAATFNFQVTYEVA